MKTPILQHEFIATGSAFNLVIERTTDGERERNDAEARRKIEAEIKEYVGKMQRTFEHCPGFVGGDLPKADGCVGRVLIEPECVKAAMPWLKRRFIVGSEAGIETTGELSLLIQSRKKKVAGQKRQRQSITPVEQFKLAI